MDCRHLSGKERQTALDDVASGNIPECRVRYLFYDCPLQGRRIIYCSRHQLPGRNRGRTRVIRVIYYESSKA